MLLPENRPDLTLLNVSFGVFQHSMDAYLQVNGQMDGAKRLRGTKSEDSLLVALTETIQGLEAVRRSRDQHNGTAGGRRCLGQDEQRGSEEGTLSAAEDERGDERRGLCVDEEQEEKECRQKVLGVLRELSGFYSGRLEVWRGALRKCAAMFMKCPAGGDDLQRPSPAGTVCGFI